LIEKHEECLIENYDDCLIEKHERSHVKSTVQLMLCAQLMSNLKHVECSIESLIKNLIKHLISSHEECFLLS